MSSAGVTVKVHQGKIIFAHDIFPEKKNLAHFQCGRSRRGTQGQNNCQERAEAPGRNSQKSVLLNPEP